MLPSLEDREAAKYREAFAIPGYRRKCHGLELWTQHRELFPDHVESALDIGCGTGRLVEAWRRELIDGYGVDLVAEQSVDPEIFNRWRKCFYVSPLWTFTPSRQFHIGCCADVMEHIPESHVSSVLRNIGACCSWVLFKIANFDSWVNRRQLHLTKRSREWWRGVILSCGGSVEEPAFETTREEYVFTWVPCRSRFH